MFARVRALIGRLFFAVLRVRVVDSEPGRHRPMVIAAPHTSLFDGLLLIGMVWVTGYNAKAMIEQRFFKGPFDRLFRAMGGVPINRTSPIGVVEAFTAYLDDPTVTVVMAPEGTRSKRDYWKTGFYRIARSADVPVTLAYVDMNTRTVGLGPTIELTGNVAADMDRIRAFYAGKRGWKAGNETEPRLRCEPTDDASLVRRR